MSQAQKPFARLSTSIVATMVAVASLLPGSGQAQDVENEAPAGAAMDDPRGVYFHAWTGSSAGTGWLLCFSRRAQRYRCSDTSGNGFDFTIAEDGSWLVDTSSDCRGSSGVFADGMLRLDWSCADTSYYSSLAQRAPHTDAAFPVRIRRTEPGEDGLSGNWTSVSTQVSPTTGAALSRTEEDVRVAVSGKTFRVTFPDGEYVQGPFIAADRVAFRVRQPDPADPRFKTLQGSATSHEVNVLGVAEIRGPDRIEIDILTQSRAPVSQQAQHQYRYVLTR